MSKLKIFQAGVKIVEIENLKPQSAENPAEPPSEKPAPPKPKLSIWSGGVRVVDLEDEKTKQEAVNKFDTCAYRSEDEKVEVHHSCCSSRTTRGFICSKHQIYPLKSSQCVACQEYQKK